MQFDFSPKSLSEKWQCKRNHVLALIALGHLKAFNVCLQGTQSKRPVYRISAEEVERFERERLVANVPESTKYRASRKSTPAKFYA